VLDNCGHVLQAAGSLVVALAGNCPPVRIVTTSRRRRRSLALSRPPTAHLSPLSVRLFPEGMDVKLLVVPDCLNELAAAELLRRALDDVAGRDWLFRCSSRA
jgi:hypothetical protein